MSGKKLSLSVFGPEAMRAVYRLETRINEALNTYRGMDDISSWENKMLVRLTNVRIECKNVMDMEVCAEKRKRIARIANDIYDLCVGGIEKIEQNSIIGLAEVMSSFDTEVEKKIKLIWTELGTA